MTQPSTAAVEETTFTCDKCGIDFSTKYRLASHMKRKIPCDTVFKCEPCNKSFDSNKKLYEHFKSDSCSNTFECSHCNIQLSSPSNLARHVKICKKRIDANDASSQDVYKKIEKYEEYFEAINRRLNDLERCNIMINSNTVNNFGSEDMSFITFDIFKDIVLSEGFGMKKFIELMSFNKNHPENMNAIVFDEYSRHGLMKQNGVWLYYDIGKLPMFIIKNCVKTIRMLYNDHYKNKMKEVDKTFHHQFDEYTTGPHKDIPLNSKDDITMLIDFINFRLGTTNEIGKRFHRLDIRP